MKKARSLREEIEASEVHITAIHQVEGSDFEEQLIQQVDVVHLPAGHINIGRNAAPQIQQGMQLDRALAATKLRPGEQGQTQIDGGGVEGIDGLGQVHAERFVAVEVAGHADEHLGEVAIDSPVANLVGIGERGARNSTSETHVIELRLLSAQTGFDVAQTAAIGELSESQTEELIPAREIFDVAIALVAIDAKLKLVARNELHELRENRLARVHGLPPKQSGEAVLWWP